MMAKGKNLAKLIGKIGLAGMLSLGTNNGNVSDDGGTYDRIFLTYHVSLNGLTDFAGINAYRKNENCEWAYIQYKDQDNDISFDEITYKMQTNKNKAIFESIGIGKYNSEIQYVKGSLMHSVDECKSISAVEKKVNIRSKNKSDFSQEVQDRILKMNNMRIHCNDDWKFFLKKEVNKTRTLDDLTEKSRTHKVKKDEHFYEISEMYGASMDDILSANNIISGKGKFIFDGQELKIPLVSQNEVRYYGLMYFGINQNGFATRMDLVTTNKENKELARLAYIDTDKDYNYDLIRMMAPGKKEEIRINYETGEMSYKKFDKDSLELQKTGKSQNDFSPEIQKRIKGLVNLKVDCSENELIPFLYEEYGKWSEE